MSSRRCPRILIHDPDDLGFLKDIQTVRLLRSRSCGYIHPATFPRLSVVSDEAMLYLLHTYIILAYFPFMDDIPIGHVCSG